MVVFIIIKLKDKLMNNTLKYIGLLILFISTFYINHLTEFDYKVKLFIEIILGIIFFSILIQLISKRIIFEKLINTINESISGEINPYIFAIFRIIFGIFSFKMIYHSYDFIEVVRYNFDTNLIVILKYLYYPTLIVIVFIIVGFGGRIPYLVNFIGSLYLHGDVGTSLYMAISFWILFMGTDNVLKVKFKYNNRILNKILNYTPKPFIWPSILLGLNVGFLISSAGISKLLDPVWFNNMGFYYTYLQPWIKVQHINFILNYEFIVVLLNWATIITEIIVLPLMLFRKTRLFAGIFTFLMFVILTYPIRIDAIGPFGMLIGLIIIFSSIKIKQTKLILTYRLCYFPSLTYAFLLISMLGVTQIEYLRNNIKYPKLNIPYVLKEDLKNKKIIYENTFNNIPFLNPASIYRIFYLSSMTRIPLVWYSPFNNGHFFGRIIYKIGIKENNKIIFPFEIFNDDGTMKKTKYSGRILYPRVLQNRIWAIEMLKISIAQNKNLNNLPRNPSIMVEKLLYFYMNLYDKMGYDTSHLYIFYKNIFAPNEYIGYINACENQNWEHFLDFDTKNNKLDIVKIPTKMNLQRYKFPYFEENLIEANPLYYYR